MSKDGGLAISDRSLSHAVAIVDKAEESWRKVFGSGPSSGGYIAARATELLGYVQAHASTEGIPYWQASRALKMDKVTFEKALQTLRVWEQVHVEERVTSGRPATLLWPTKAAK